MLSRPPGEPPNCGDTEDQFCEQSGSIIECQNQILGQRIPVVGTPFTLNYRSDRVPGRLAARTVNIPVTGSSVPAESFSRSCWRLRWPGENSTTHLLLHQISLMNLHGTAMMLTAARFRGGSRRPSEIGYKYPMIYYPVPSDFDDAFGRMNPSTEVVVSRELQTCLPGRHGKSP